MYKDGDPPNCKGGTVVPDPAGQKYCDPQKDTYDYNLKAMLQYAKSNYPTNPLMIAESTVQPPLLDSSTSWIDALKRMAAVITEFEMQFWTYIGTDWPEVKAVHFYPPVWGDSRLDQNKEVLK